jgi:hypothetical protein
LENIEDTLALCQDDPPTLVRTLMVIEMEVMLPKKAGKFRKTLGSFLENVEIAVF